MRLNLNQFIAASSFLIVFVLILPTAKVDAQGRMVRGVKKVEYSLPGAKADFYVSPSGNDNWTGKLAEPNKAGTDGPFATIEQAKAAVRALKAEVYQLKKPAVDKRFIGTPHRFGSGRDILVLIRQGVYNLDSALVFKPDDGGERIETDLPTGAFEYHELEDCFVTYAAYPGENPVISGGARITGWEKAGKGKWAAKINSGEVNDLYANGKRMTLARTPNNGYYLTDGQPTDSTYFRFNGKDIQPWKNLEEARIKLVVRWGSQYNAISKVDIKKHLAFLKKPTPDILLVPPKYYIENLEALLDTAGEWFYNKTDQVISFIPGPDIKNPNEANMVIPQLNDLIQVVGTREKPVRNLRFYNLIFSNTRDGGSATLSAQYSKNCEWLYNHIENVGQTAIRLGLGCYHNLINKNIINDTHGSGIVVSGDKKPGDWNDVVSDNTISYNKVTNLRPAVTGISVFNANRNVVSHNYVSNVGSYGITLGSWPNIEETSDGGNVAEYNDVSFTNMERDDEGGIAVYGLSPGSVVRNNLIHDVHPAATNENVAFFFQNMSKEWKVANNIYYNLKQGEMKLCACYLVDNIYKNNFIVETPEVQPEQIIDGNPYFLYDQLEVSATDQKYTTGNDINISAKIYNQGSTGMDQVFLYVDGKVVKTQLFPVIAKNSRTIKFSYKFGDPGKHKVAIGTTQEKELDIQGKPQFLIFHNLNTSLDEIPQGDSLTVRVDAQNVRDEKITQKIELLDNGKTVAVREISFAKEENKTLEFSFLPNVGSHSLVIGSLSPMKIKVYPARKVDTRNAVYSTYCSATAQPGTFSYDAQKSHFEISAAGTDFLHAEDSYGTIYLKGAIKGDFVAMVRVMSFSKDISEWFRAGIFVRNDLAKSHTSEPGSLGSFLLFTTTKRCGAEWDEFGNGCMHNTKSTNYGVDNPIPVWLKLVRHGNRFSGYYSFDGKDWVLSRESGEIPGLAKTMDIGLAGGSNDQRVSKVIFEDFQLAVEDK
ncbi:MAG: right-handed parallel beta-helix repeat-containing protein [Bacteroidota bacterium]|nr:right-handed parallel beta-helix repeat-containing protein [Bacteroidota bacterium]